MNRFARPAAAVAFLIPLAVLLASLSLPWASDPPPPEPLERARSIADRLGSSLMSRLVAELQAGGPPGAVKVCSEIALSMAASHADAATTVRRVSLRFRNPADAPDAWERERLEDMETLHREGKLPKEIALTVAGEGGRRFRYMRPILVGSPCLACHGPVASIDPEVRRLLAERYPADRAVGYAAGDFRGAVSISIDLPDAAPSK